MNNAKLRGVLAAAVLTGAVFATGAPALGEEVPAEEEAATATLDSSNRAMLYIGGFAGASFCVAVSVLGAAWAVAKVGTAAMGAVAEKPELMGRSMVYVGLAEGLAIYGLIVAIMILGRLP